MKVAIATCHTFPNLSESDRLYSYELMRLGIQVSVLPWNSSTPERFLENDIIILRATWDYQHEPQVYANWLRHLDRQGAKILNAPELAIWNNDKRHLIELASKGALVVETTDLSKVDDIDAFVKNLETSPYVLKPVYGGSGVGVQKTSKESLKADLDSLKIEFPNRDFMLQPFLPEIFTGELSIIFIGGAYAHSILKTPQKGEFRVNSGFGTSKKRVDVAEQTIIEASQILTYVNSVTLYARVDGVIKNGHFLCTELELTDPSLMFDLALESALKMAKLTHDILVAT